MHTLIRQARKDRGLTQAEVATAVGRDQATVARWETGKQAIPPEVAPALARCLGLTILQVLYGSDDPTTPQPEAAHG